MPGSQPQAPAALRAALSVASQFGSLAISGTYLAWVTSPSFADDEDCAGVDSGEGTVHDLHAIGGPEGSVAEVGEGRLALTDAGAASARP